MKIEYDYTSVPTVEEFSESDKFIRAIIGPFGSGKSSGCVMEIMQRAIEQAPDPLDGIRKSRWAIIRNTFPQLRDTTIKTVHDWFPPEKFGAYKVSDNEYVIEKIKGCHIHLLYRALDRPEHVANLLSMELTGAWINEAREIPKSIFDALQGRVGRYPSARNGGCTWSGVIMDTNPPDTDSWLYQLFEESRKTDGLLCQVCEKPAVNVFNKGSDSQQAYCPEHTNIELFRQPSGFSPDAENLAHLPKDYYRNLAIGKDEEFIKVYIRGEYGFIMDGKPVYPEYRDSTHCQEFEVIRGATIRRGWDFGLTPSVSFSQMAPNGQWRVIDEIVSENIAIDRLSDEVITYCNQRYPGFPFEDFGDPAGDSRSQVDERTCFQILRAKGIRIEPGDQDPGLRIESVKKALNTMIDGKPGFLIHPRCQKLRKGFQGGYRYRKIQTTGEHFSEKPEKNDYSHIHDALQYDATRLFGARLMIPKPVDKRIRHRAAQSGSWMSA